MVGSSRFLYSERAFGGLVNDVRVKNEKGKRKKRFLISSGLGKPISPYVLFRLVSVSLFVPLLLFFLCQLELHRIETHNFQFDTTIGTGDRFTLVDFLGNLDLCIAFWA